MTPIPARVRSRIAAARPRAAAVGVFAIMALALALRLYGLDWDDGYAWTPHPDERAILGYAAQISPPPLSDLAILLDAERSPWNPRWFPYGSFPLYLLRGVHAVAESALAADLADMRLMARAISALADVCGVGAVYLLASALRSRRAGLIAALIVALAVTHVQLSHFFAVDTILALFCAATVIFLIRVARWGRAADSAFAGLFFALALATKISAAPMLAAYFAAHLIYALGMAPADPRFRRPLIFDAALTAAINAAIGGLVALIAFFVFQPYAILDFGNFFADVSEQSEMARRIRDYPFTRQYIDTAPYLYHIRQLAAWGFGLPLGALAWAALAYAAVRGMSWRAAAAYAATGVALPAAVMVVSTSALAVIAAVGIASLALIATLPARKPSARLDVILLAWVAPYFIIMGALDVKFMRYMLPITPFLAIFAAGAVVDAWAALSRLRGAVGATARAAALALGIAILCATALYALAYARIYSAPHPAVRAAEWVRDNLPERSLILKEHWDEALPSLYEYETRELPMYDPDTRGKMDALALDLSEADALIVYSNRLYGTTPRLPERYPLTRAYYEMLFDRQLGYEPAARFTSYPNLYGVSLTNETFARPGLPEPRFPVEDGIAPPAALPISLGYADESFTVYDHPKVMIFSNVSRLSPDIISERIISAGGGIPASERPVTEIAPDKLGLMMDAPRAAAQRAGGTWSAIVNPDGWASRLPVLAWLLAMEGAALLAFPLAFAAFGSLADRGWLLAKALGLLVIGFAAWLMASLEIMPFGRASVAVAAIATGVFAIIAAIANRAEIVRFFRERWKTVALAELIFLAAFFAFVLVRMANPDLWHPWRGGEKPMDMAYLTAVLKSSYMPPYDPWFGGGYLNYYYFGQFLTAALIHATGITPEIAVNAAIPGYYALTAALAYSIAYNLAAATSTRAGRPRRPRPNPLPSRERGSAGGNPILLSDEYPSPEEARGRVHSAAHDSPSHSADLQEYVNRNQARTAVSESPLPLWERVRVRVRRAQARLSGRDARAPRALICSLTGEDLREVDTRVHSAAHNTPSPLTGEGRGEGDARVHSAAHNTPSPLMGEGGDERERRVHSAAHNTPSPLTGEGRGEGESAARFGAVRNRPYIAGLLGAAFVAVLGNMDGAVQVWQGAWSALVLGLPAPDFDFWRASRMMPPDPPGWEITEFPFFTFLFADPHAHLFALPFTLLAIGCAAAFVLDAAPRNPLWTPARLMRLAALGLAVGSLRAINTWDYPTYLALAFAAVFVREYLAHGGLALAPTLRAAAQSAAVFAVGFLAFLPYQMSYETFFLGVQTTTNTTPLNQFLAIAGLFAFAAASFCLWELRRPLSRAISQTARLFGDLRAVLADNPAAPPASGIGVSVSASGAVAARTSALRSLEAPLAVTIIAFVILTAGFALTAALSGWEWATVAVSGAMVCMSLAVGVRAMSRPASAFARPTAFAALTSAAGFSLVIALDIVRVEGDIERMNSVFKFYMQIWVLLALASAFAVWRLLGTLGFGIGARGGVRPRLRAAWTIALSALVLVCAVYPVLGTRDRLSDRFNDSPPPLTLDGLAYADGAVYRDPKGDVDLSQDMAAIRWMRENIEGSPVILEANTPTYQWGSRISIHTGLPGAVGWEWHQQQQRWDYRAEVSARIRDVERIYSTTNADAAAALIAEYGIAYIYVGALERLYYPPEGIAKFADGRMPNLEAVYDRERRDNLPRIGRERTRRQLNPY